jgi:hypothetical protein
LIFSKKSITCGPVEVQTNKNDKPQDSAIKTNTILVALSSLAFAAAAPADSVAGWVGIFDGDGNASITGADTASPVVSNAHRSSIAANLPTTVTLADGDFIKLTGSASFNKTLASTQFRVGLFDGDDPVTVGDGQGYAGVYIQAGTNVGGPVDLGDGTATDHPFSSGAATQIGTMSNPNNTPEANTTIDFTLTITRHGNKLDIAGSFTDGGAYHSTVDLQDVGSTYYTYNSAAFLMGGGFEAGLEATYSDIEVVTGKAPEPPEDPEKILGTRLFGIDFNRDDQFGSPSQSKCRVVSGSASDPSANQASYTRTIGAWQATVARPDGQPFEFRGANGDSSRAIPGGDVSRSFLVADFIGTRSGRIDITVSGLPAGDYVFRSFHLDPFTGAGLGFAQGATSTTPNTIEARIGGTTMASVQPTALGSSGLDTTFIDNSQVPTLIFPFTHDGSGPVTIELHATESNGSDSFLLLNGFEIFTAKNP